jgi:hypothetical protein
MKKSIVKLFLVTQIFLHCNVYSCFIENDLTLNYESLPVTEMYSDNRILKLTGDFTADECDCEKITFLYNKYKASMGFNKELIVFPSLRFFGHNTQNQVKSILSCLENNHISDELLADPTLEVIDKLEFIYIRTQSEIISKFSDLDYEQLLNSSYLDLDERKDYFRFNRILTIDDQISTHTTRVSEKFSTTLSNLRNPQSQEKVLSNDMFFGNDKALLSALTQITVKSRHHQYFLSMLEKEISLKNDNYLIDAVLHYIGYVLEHDYNNTSLYPSLDSLFRNLAANSSKEQKQYIYSIFLQTMYVTLQNPKFKEEYLPRLNQYYTHVILPRAIIDADEIAEAKSFVAFFE